MKKYHKYIGILFLGLLLSCSEDFLELSNPNALSLSNYPTSTNDVEQMLQGAYGTQHSNGLYGHTMGPKTFFCWDHTMNLAWQGTQTWINMAQNDTNPSDSFIQGTWRDLYLGIQRANTILGVVADFRENKPGIISEGDLDAFEGQAYYLRGWMYFQLISIWGEDFIINGQGGDKAGVPIISQVAGSIVETDVPRSSVRESWDLVISDLTKSATLLDGITWTGPDAYKANSMSVKALLGKAYAFTDDWNSALPLLKDVVDNSGKSLVSFEVYKDMFNGNEANEFNNESLLEIPLTDDPAGNSNTDKSTGSWWGMILAPSWTGANGAPQAGGWSNEYVHEKNLSRFGYNLDHYFDANVTTINSSNIRPNYISEALAARTDGSVDPRLYVATLQPYVDTVLVAGAKVSISHYTDGVEVNREAWSSKKYQYLLDKQTAVRNGGANIILLRMADVYLLYAEALIKTGDPTLGLEYINKVHRRAYDYPVDTPSPIDYLSLTAPTKASDAVLANDPLKYERFAELFAEGHKWYDMRRWKIGAEEAAYYESVRGGTINWSDTDYAQPIPTLEIESNSAIDFGDQNPGYN
ncbi:RagB/SusD family nutrient uptake outer membrane protein [Arenibacter algicola]|uniref:SusD family protein n=1 Tax=Arenibacter algicola TaxID=616991 RepID=A0A221US03_9FLAO|nr:RagB/SusD family nutrient uptake outer membrane protein [Arenibacter algicola]ASO04127.1 SusD family protein [Arenibacter algicola]